MNFPRRKEATNKDLILTIINIQGYLMRYGESHTNWHETLNEVIERLEQQPTVTPQEPQTFKWCTDCREYDQEKHCCHRWSKVIRDTVEEMRQEYIEREVLDKIRAEIIAEIYIHSGTGEEVIQAYDDGLKRGLDIIDKYKAESEDKG